METTSVAVSAQHENNLVVEKTDANTQDMMLASAAGLIAAILGGLIWFVIALITKWQIGYIALLVGIMVGAGMKIIMKDRKSLILAIVAVFLTVFGIVFGKFLIWQFEMPNLIRSEIINEFKTDTVYSELNVSESTLKSVYTDDYIRTQYPFGDFLVDDLTPGGDTSIETKGSVLILFAYLLAPVYAFQSMYSFKKKAKA